jgi:hypothetical protein
MERSRGEEIEREKRSRGCVKWTTVGILSFLSDYRDAII